MAGKPEVKPEEPSSRTPRPRAARLAIPDNIAAKFGVLYHDERQAQGVVKTDDIAELMSVLGIHDPGHITLPTSKRAGTRDYAVELRIEGSAAHSTPNGPVVGHQWIVRQTMPELTA